ncbi:hypothetical protein [Polystyrenella longa]|nr:hypothetical protein [Polystyrenella longa]
MIHSPNIELPRKKTASGVSNGGCFLGKSICSSSFCCGDTMPEGTPRKLLDVSKLTNLGWQPTTPLEAGLPIAYDWYRQHECSVESLSA